MATDRNESRSDQGDDHVVLAVLAEMPEVRENRIAPTRQRAVLLPLSLFAATCFSTYWVFYVQSGPRAGLLYMTAVMGILLAHEMGHFLQALRYKIPASLPFFIPMPLTPIGTMGAVIGMQGSSADRKQMFDIGISGPWAGLVVAIPVSMLGILTADFVVPPPGTLSDFTDPLMFQAMIAVLRPDLPAGAELVMNPFLMAGWVGMLITGLNMLPVSQLDGGHMTYALFGKRAHYIARGFLFLAAAYMIVTDTYVWTIMLVLVALIGCDHPPTANDRVPLGPLRWAIGIVSLAIPVLCFMPDPMPGLMR